jgi:E1A/CREB-binding protein
MNTRMAPVTTQMAAIKGANHNSGGSGGMSPSTATTSPVSSMIGMGSPHHQSNIGMKPGAQIPSPNVLQVVKQVQEEAARQQVPPHGGFGKVTPTGAQMPPPVLQRNMVPGHMGVVGGPGVMQQQQQQQPQNQQVGVPMQGGVGGIGGPGVIPGPGNLMSMDQWGNGNRYPNGNNPGIRPANVQQMMQQQQQNPMQQVNLTF